METIKEKEAGQSQEIAHHIHIEEYLAPYVATPMDVVEKMLDMANVTSDDVVYDIGCGDGRIAIMAAEKFGAYSFGIDIDPHWVLESTKNAKKAGVENRTTFFRGDATSATIPDATVVALYQHLKPNEALRPLFESQLDSGARVVSHNYPIPGWGQNEVAVTKIRDHSIYLYVVDARDFQGHNIPYFVG